MYASMHGVCVCVCVYMEVTDRERERVYSWKVSNKVHTTVFFNR